MTIAIFVVSSAYENVARGALKLKGKGTVPPSSSAASSSSSKSSVKNPVPDKKSAKSDRKEKEPRAYEMSSLLSLLLSRFHHRNGVFAEANRVMCDRVKSSSKPIRAQMRRSDTMPAFRSEYVCCAHSNNHASNVFTRCVVRNWSDSRLKQRFLIELKWR